MVRDAEQDIVDFDDVLRQLRGACWRRHVLQRQPGWPRLPLSVADKHNSLTDETGGFKSRPTVRAPSWILSGLTLCGVHERHSQLHREGDRSHRARKEACGTSHGLGRGRSQGCRGAPQRLRFWAVMHGRATRTNCGQVSTASHKNVPFSSRSSTPYC